MENLDIAFDSDKKNILACSVKSNCFVYNTSECTRNAIAVVAMYMKHNNIREITTEDGILKLE